MPHWPRSRRSSADYLRIAERRVRLGLLLSEIGAANGVEVSDQEMRNLIGQAASQYQGKERERFLQLVQQEPMFAAQLRAPLYEDKVVDFLFDKAEISERKATREQLEADLESEESHVHGPDCGHDHAHDESAHSKQKPKKASSKKTAAKPDKLSSNSSSETAASTKTAKASAKAEPDSKATKDVQPVKPAKASSIEKAVAKTAEAKKPKAAAKPAASSKAAGKSAEKAAGKSGGKSKSSPKKS